MYTQVDAPGIVALILAIFFIATIFNYSIKRNSPIGRRNRKIKRLAGILNYQSKHMLSFVPLIRNILTRLDSLRDDKQLSDFEFNERTLFFCYHDHVNPLFTMQITGEVSAPNTIHLLNLHDAKIKKALEALLSERRDLTAWSYMSQGGLMHRLLNVKMSP